jgi:predicted glycoside hydrolase/deacetylase ChbG (UPF0249 family)
MILCADDYGQSPAVSTGIRELLRMRRLSATTCSVVGQFWLQDAARLRALDFDADIGLHFTLTNVEPLGRMPRLAPYGRMPSINQLMALAHARLLNQREIEEALTRQIEHFHKGMHRPPDFIDGHQHAHQLPIIRDVVLDAFNRAGLSNAYLRVCTEPPAAIRRRGVAVGKALVINVLGRRLKKLAEERRLRINDSFRGVYDFSDRIPYGTLFDKFAAGATERTIIMCHPGHVDELLRRIDPVTDQREVELAYFKSEAFGRHQASLNRYPR